MKAYKTRLNTNSISAANRKSYFQRRNTAAKRALALVLTLCVASTATPAFAQEYTAGLSPTYDEAYYGVLDYYGNLTDGSIVKSYVMHGADSITDYGNYKQVNNLTDGTKPTSKNGITRFNFKKGKAPEHFYFEGKNSEIYNELPWKISMTYKLNGVSIEANKLAGKNGMVEIDLHIVPNTSASDYMKNNYTLEALTVFNQSDILSLEQEGGQVQLVGNLRTVVFAAMPGAEEHFKIMVGTDKFGFSGFTFLMAPVTLSQMGMLSDLHDKKDKIEEDYNKLSGSIDRTLDALSSMQSSLNSSAAGLDELNNARGIISAGKESIYNDMAASNKDFAKLSIDIEPIYQHLADTSKAVSDSNSATQTIVKSANSMKNNLKDISKSLNGVKGNLDKIKNSTDSLSKNNKSIKNLISKTKDLSGYVENISDSLDNLNNVSPGASGNTSQLSDSTELIKAYNVLKTDKNGAATTLGLLTAAGLVNQSGITDEKATITALIKNKLSVSDVTAAALAEPVAAAVADSSKAAAFAEIETNNGLPTGTLSSILAGYKNIKRLAPYYVIYKNTNGGNPNIKEFAAAAINASYAAKGQAINDLSVEQLASTVALLYAQSNNGDDVDGLKALIDNINKNINGTLNDASNTLNNNINSISRPTSELLKRASDVLNDLDVLSKTLDDLEHVNKAVGDSVQNTKDIVDKTSAAIDKINEIIDEINELQNIMNDYEPKAQNALKNMQELSMDTSKSLKNLSSLISDTTNLSKKSGTSLDKGTLDTLSSLSSTLRRTADAVGTAKDIKSAKNDIDSIIRDIWDDHTGKVDNLLNMDTSLPSASLTSDKNPAPTTVQVLIRSQEIKVDNSAEKAAAEDAIENSSFWGRIKQMFIDIGHAIANLFK